MVALLLSQEANINAITEETQETALTLACCGGFVEVADFLIQVRGGTGECGELMPGIQREVSWEEVRISAAAAASLRWPTSSSRSEGDGEMWGNWWVVQKEMSVKWKLAGMHRKGGMQGKWRGKINDNRSNPN